MSLFQREPIARSFATAILRSIAADLFVLRPLCIRLLVSGRIDEWVAFSRSHRSHSVKGIQLLESSSLSKGVKKTLFARLEIVILSHIQFLINRSICVNGNQSVRIWVGRGFAIWQPDKLRGKQHSLSCYRLFAWECRFEVRECLATIAFSKSIWLSAKKLKTHFYGLSVFSPDSDRVRRASLCALSAIVSQLCQMQKLSRFTIITRKSSSALTL
jgi:hypothetical protein